MIEVVLGDVEGMAILLLLGGDDAAAAFGSSKTCLVVRTISLAGKG
jgi:hypothetical protein